MRQWINLFETQIDFSAPPYATEDDEPILPARAHAIINAVTKFSKPLPIRVELSSYRNPYSGDVQGVTLTDLYADTPGDGYGTRVMNLLCSLADEADISLYTDPEGPRSKAFYEKFGFERNQRGTPMLVRYPPLPSWALEEDIDSYH